MTHDSRELLWPAASGRQMRIFPPLQALEPSQASWLGSRISRLGTPGKTTCEPKEIVSARGKRVNIAI